MKTTFITTFIIIGIQMVAQQDPQYSQYMFNRVLINPAYIGSKDVPSITLLSRKEWVNVSGAPQTNNFSFSTPIQSNKMGIGGHLVQETIGPKNWLTGYVDYCYRIKLARGIFSFGVSAGAVAYNFNTSKLDLYDKNEPTLQANSVTQAVRFDMNAGIYYYTRSFYLGISATHLTSPKLFETNSRSGSSTKFYDLNQHIFLTLGKGFLMNDGLIFNPSLMIKSVTGKNINADVNANFLIKNKVIFGISLRSSYNLVGLIQYHIQDKFRIGYSYDYGFKGISKISSGSHEISLSFDFTAKKSKIITTRLL